MIYIPPQGVLRLLPDPSSVTEPITSILWKHGLNKATEWDLGFGPDVDYYRTYRDRTELDKETGQLVINNMTIEDIGEYSVEINGRLLSKTTVKQMSEYELCPVKIMCHHGSIIIYNVFCPQKCSFELKF